VSGAIPIEAANQMWAAKERLRQRQMAELGAALAAVSAGNLDRLQDVVTICRRLGLEPDTVLAHPSNR
jgi:hypothetical protein